MDSKTLVDSGHTLINELDKAGLGPQLAMWVYTPDTDTWKLWIVSPSGIAEKWEFYSRVAKIISRNRDKLGSIDASDTKLVEENHPAVKGVSKFMKLPGLGDAYFAGNKFDDFYLPDSIILRSNLH